MMQFVPPNTSFDFVGRRHLLLMVSAGMILLCLGLILVRGPKLGIDFAGGSLVQVRFAAATETDAVRKALGGTLAAVDIQDMGREQTEFLIRLPLSAEESESVNNKVTAALAQSFGRDQVEILRVEAVGPRVGQELRQKAILAVLFATLMMGVYIWIRFEWRFGVGAAVALLHDVVITVGALIVAGYEFDLTIVAALLTIVGFSVNDTVIVSDRIRENRSKDRRAPLAAVINRSVNETLSRTIMTQGLTLVMVVSLYFLGGEIIHDFALALLVGFVVGTYSSIYVASPIVLTWEERSKKK